MRFQCHMFWQSSIAIKGLQALSQHFYPRSHCRPRNFLIQRLKDVGIQTPETKGRNSFVKRWFICYWDSVYQDRISSVEGGIFISWGGRFVFPEVILSSKALTLPIKCFFFLGQYSKRLCNIKERQAKLSWGFVILAPCIWEYSHQRERGCLGLLFIHIHSMFHSFICVATRHSFLSHSQVKPWLCFFILLHYCWTKLALSPSRFLWVFYRSPSSFRWLLHNLYDQFHPCFLCGELHLLCTFLIDVLISLMCCCANSLCSSIGVLSCPWYVMASCDERKIPQRHVKLSWLPYLGSEGGKTLSSLAPLLTLRSACATGLLMPVAKSGVSALALVLHNEFFMAEKLPSLLIDMRWFVEERRPSSLSLLVLFMMHPLHLCLNAPKNFLQIEGCYEHVSYSPWSSCTVEELFSNGSVLLLFPCHRVLFVAKTVINVCIVQACHKRRIIFIFSRTQFCEFYVAFFPRAIAVACQKSSQNAFCCCFVHLSTMRVVICRKAGRD